MMISLWIAACVIVGSLSEFVSAWVTPTTELSTATTTFVLKARASASSPSLYSSTVLAATPDDDHTNMSVSRRDLLGFGDGTTHDNNVAQIAVATSFLFFATAAAADPPRAWAQPTEFQSVGTQAPLPYGETNAFVTLENGVKIKEFRDGKPEGPSVGTNSVVAIQCTGRLLNLNGVIFYSTKKNNPDGFGPEPLTFTMGQGQALPGLEAGILGMKKGGIRRIIVPAELAYSKYPSLEPKPTDLIDQRALDSVLKNPRRDATILFDVQVERVKG